MVRIPAVLPLLLLCAFGVTLANDTAPWPGYLGPTRDGRADAEGLFDGKRPVGLEIAWRKPLGAGYSGIAVDRKRAYSTYSNGGTDVLSAFDLKSGEKLWTFDISPTVPKIGGAEKGPLSTPAVGDGSVYALGPKGRLVALDAANGKLRWARDVVDDLGARPPRFGVTTSPLLVGELLIVQVGKSNSRTACAFLRDSGEIQWCTGGSALGYQSPVFTSLMKRKQIIAVSDTELFGIEPETGDVLWSHTYEPAGGEGGSHPIAAGDDRLLIESETGFALYAFSGTSNKPTVQKVWENSSLKKSFDLPVHHDGFIYGHSRNTFLCLDAATGEMKWRTQTPGEGEAIAIGDYLAIWSLRKGTLHLARATPDDYQEIAVEKILAKGSYTTPAYADGLILLRNMKEIAAVRIVLQDAS